MMDGGWDPVDHAKVAVDGGVFDKTCRRAATSVYNITSGGQGIFEFLKVRRTIRNVQTGRIFAAGSSIGSAWLLRLWNFIMTPGIRKGPGAHPRSCSISSPQRHVDYYYSIADIQQPHWTGPRVNLCTANTSTRAQRPTLFHISEFNFKQLFSNWIGT